MVDIFVAFCYTKNGRIAASFHAMDVRKGVLKKWNGR